ncbi:hypothetical protein DIPPA_27532 [Diplonema papillatum]|nr:hypothetical protein DIPPA_27532 [Diplonema papillatum]
MFRCSSALRDVVKRAAQRQRSLKEMGDVSTSDDSGMAVHIANCFSEDVAVGADSRRGMSLYASIRYEISQLQAAGHKMDRQTYRICLHLLANYGQSDAVRMFMADKAYRKFHSVRDYISLMQACLKSSNYDGVQDAYADLRKSGQSRTLSGQARARTLHILLKVKARRKQHQSAVQLAASFMQLEAVALDRTVLELLMQAAPSLEAAGRHLLQMRALRLPYESSTYAALLTACGTPGEARTLWKVFQANAVELDEVTYPAVAMLFRRLRRPDCIANIMRDMVARGVPLRYTIHSAFLMCVSEVIEHRRSNGPTPEMAPEVPDLEAEVPGGENTHTCSEQPPLTLFDQSVDCRHVDDLSTDDLLALALQALHAAQLSEVVRGPQLYVALLSCYAAAGKPEEAERLRKVFVFDLHHKERLKVTGLVQQAYDVAGVNHTVRPLPDPPRTKAGHNWFT